MTRFVDWRKTGMKIRMLMNENGYTISSLASELFKSESSIKNYIYAKTNIPLDILLNMVTIFHLDKIEDILVLSN